MQKNTIAALVALAAAFAAAPSHAAPVSVEIIGPSYHSVKKDTTGYTYNNFTPGLGIGYTMTDNLTASAGVYRNSFKHPTWFAELDYTPFHYGRFDFGAGAGLVTGYKAFNGGHRVQPMAGFVARYHIQPTAAVELRVVPFCNGVDPKHSTAFGALFNIAARFYF